MKMMKKILAGLTTCAMLAGCMICFPAAAEETTGTEGTYESLTYMNYGDYIEITDFDESVTEVVIPEAIDGVPVTSIGKYAFQYCDAMTSVTIPDSVVKIGESAFYGCDALESVAIPDSVTELGYNAFCSCEGLSSVTLSENLTTIGSSVFSYCEALTTIHLPASVETIGKQAFDDCNGLESITVSEENTTYKSIDGVLLNKEGTVLLQYPDGKTDAAYTIPDGVETIGEHAFDFQPHIKELYLPASLESYPVREFLGCFSFTAVHVSEENDYFKSIDGVLFSKDGTQLCLYPACKADSAYTVPDSVTSINDFAFESNGEYLMSVTLPEGLKTIGQYSFASCYILESINLPDSLESIGASAFAYCYALNGITLPSDLTYLGGYALSYCKSLTEITIPETITVLDYATFFGCYNLASVTLPDTLTLIQPYTFEDCYDMTSISIPAGVTEIGYSAFSECESLTDVYFAGSEEEWNAIVIGYDNDYLLNATIHFGSGGTGTPTPTPDPTPTEGTYGVMAYQNYGEYIVITGCDADAAEVEIPAEIDGVPVTGIAENAFFSHAALTSVIVAEGVADIGNFAFYDCSKLTSVTLPTSLNTIGAGAFELCTGLTEITIPEGTETIDSYAFNNCTGLTTVYLPGSMVSIEEFAFFDCSALTDIYYSGTEEEWNAIAIADNNKALFASVIHYDAASTGSAAPGDVNLDAGVTIVDVVFLNKALMGAETLTAEQETAADCDHDGEATSADSLMILKSLVDLVTLA